MIARRFAFLALVLVFVGSAVAATPTNSFDRYESIIKTNPFRKLGITGGGAPPPVTMSLELGGMYTDGQAKKIIVKDTKTGKSFFLNENDVVLEYKVEKIDTESQTVILSRQLEKFLLKFPERPATVAAAPPAVAPRTGYRGPLRPMPPTTPAPTTAPNPGGNQPPAVVPAPAAGSTATATPTPLRQRIIRRQNQATNAPAATPTHEAQPPAEQPKEAEGEEAVEEAPAQ